MALFPSICKDCKPPKRHLYCHSSCKEYLDAKAAHDVVSAKEREARKAERESKDVAFFLKRG